MKGRLLTTGLLVVLAMIAAKMVMAQTSESLQLDALMVEERIAVEDRGMPEKNVARVTLIYGIPAEVGAVESLRDVPLPGVKMLDEEIMSELLTRFGGEQEGYPGTVERDAGKGEK